MPSMSTAEDGHLKLRSVMPFSWCDERLDDGSVGGRLGVTQTFGARLMRKTHGKQLHKDPKLQ